MEKNISEKIVQPVVGTEANPNVPPRQQQREQEETSIDLVELFYLYLNHLWQIILFAVLGGVLAYGVTHFLITPMYTSTAQVYAGAASNESMINLSDLQIATQLTNDYRLLLKSRRLIDEVNNNLGLGMTYGKLSGMIDVTTPENTRILYIKVKSPSPTQAAAIANELARLSVEYLPEILECERASIVDNGQVPTAPSSPSYPRNIQLGALICAVLYCAFLLIRMLVDDTFATQDDIEKYLGEPPLSVIPEGKLGDFNKKKKNSRKGKKAQDE